MDILTLALAKKMIPFGEVTTTVGGDTLTWDGNTEGLECYDMGRIGKLYRIADFVPYEQVVLGEIKITNNDYSISLEQDNSMGVESWAAQIRGNASMMAVLSGYKEDVVYDGAVYIRSGLWAMICTTPEEFDGVRFSSLTIPGYTGFETTTTVVKTLDTKYLPEHLQFGEEKAFEPIMWDGNTEGKEFCGATASADGATQTTGYYKMSDMFISYEDISLKTICSDYLYNNMEGQVVENASETTLEDRKYDFSKEGDGWWFDPGNGGQIVMSDGTFVFGKGEEYETTLSRGLWFQMSELQMGELVYKVYATAMLPDVIIKPLDEKYMPILTSPSGKKFKLSVSDSGAVTATEVTE